MTSVTGNVFLVLSLATTCLLPVASAQDSQQQSPRSKSFTFGATQTDIVASLGKPDKWLAPIEGKYMHTAEEHLAGLSVWNPIWDVYMRETKNNLYEVQVGYLNDTSTSRLKPTARLVTLTVLVDKPAPAILVLSDSPEAKDICKSGCDLYAIPDITQNYILAYPSKPTPEQTHIGYGLATGFKNEPSKEEWCVVVKLILDEQPFGKPANYSGNIVKIEFRPDSLTYELNKSDLRTKEKAKKIGNWAPSPQP